jgi:hypothetical protein
MYGDDNASLSQESNGEGNGRRDGKRNDELPRPSEDTAGQYRG